MYYNKPCMQVASRVDKQDLNIGKLAILGKLETGWRENLVSILPSANKTLHITGKITQ